MARRRWGDHDQLTRTPGAPFSADADGVRLTVRVTPRAKRSAVAGLVDIGEGRTALAVRLKAPPVEGAANRALVAFLAAELGVALSDVRIVAGDRSRVKIVAVAGKTLADLEPLQAG
jgi:uncharacterized protein (TIGR00251 family)